MTIRETDESFMAMALALAEKGRYTTSPNPMVAAVLVRGGRVIARGYHRRAGGSHAEAVALARAGAKARGATLYVTLEPCVHEGRTPPCAPAIITAGVRRVVVAAKDPNPRVAGRGIALLRRAGLRVTTGVLEDPAQRQNERFRRWIASARPFVLAKAAATLDGKIAASSGRSRWITGPAARMVAMAFREEYDAVLVGAETVRKDDPLLKRRLGWSRGLPHHRVVLDGRLLIPETAKLLRDPRGVVIATARPAGSAKARRLARRGVEIWSLPAARPGAVDLQRLLRRLGARGVTGLLVEGGGSTHWSFLEAGLVDRFVCFLAPRLLGGRRSPTLVDGEGFSLRAARPLRDVELIVCGRDLLITGRLTKET